MKLEDLWITLQIIFIYITITHQVTIIIKSFFYRYFSFIRLTPGDSIYKSFLYNSPCPTRNGIECRLIIPEKLMVIEHPTFYGRSLPRNFHAAWKIEVGHVEDVCLYDERWPTKASVQASAMPSDANANSISFPSGGSVHPERRRSPLRDIDVTPVGPWNE